MRSCLAQVAAGDDSEGAGVESMQLIIASRSADYVGQHGMLVYI